MGAISERQVRQKLLRSFIDKDFIVTDLTRPVMAGTLAGGVVNAGSIVVADQKFGFVPMKRRLTEENGFNPQSFGEDRVEMVDYILIYLPGEADIQEGDYLTSIDGPLLDGDYRVMFVSHRQWDRQQAGIQRR